MKSSSLQWWKRCSLGVCLLLEGLLGLQIAWGQQRVAATAAQTAPTTTQTPASPQDSLGRTTPRGTVLGFFSASYNHRYDIAAQYLDIHEHPEAAAELARQFFLVLDKRLPPKLNSVSNDPRGSMSDPLDLRRELIGSVATSKGTVGIYLELVDRPNIAPIWLFSSDTLVKVPDLYGEVSALTQETILPGFMLRKFLGLSLVAWLFFAVLPLGYLILGLANRLLGAGVGYALRHWAGRPLIPNPNILPHPLRLLIISAAVYWLPSEISLSLIARQVGSIIAKLLLIVALVWVVVLINRACELYLRKRLEIRGRLSSTAILRPARGVMNVVAAVVGLMFALHTFGINPSAALAGLGVGGIAIALAAQKTLENVIGGASLIADEAVRVGDFFKMGDVIGTVEQIGLRSTRVRTLDRTLVTIPNGQMATMTLENFSARDNFWLHHIIRVRCETASTALNPVLLDVRELIEREPGVLPATTRVRLLRFAESALEIELYAYFSARDWAHFLEIQQDLLIRIKEVLTSAGVEVAYPTRTIHMIAEMKAEDVLPDPSRATVGTEA